MITELTRHIINTVQFKVSENPLSPPKKRKVFIRFEFLRIFTSRVAAKKIYEQLNIMLKVYFAYWYIKRRFRITILLNENKNCDLYPALDLGPLLKMVLEIYYSYISPWYLKIRGWKGEGLRHRNPVCYPRPNNVIYLYFEYF